MSSVRGNFFKIITRLTGNVNPFTHSNAIEYMQKMSKKYINGKIKNGYTFERLITGNGTNYQILRKCNAQKIERIIYYIHGGVYVTGLLSMYRDFTCDFCEISPDTAVCLLDYSLAPKFRYPTQLDEAVDVWNELTEKYKIKAENIVVGGDSSGGNLALAMMLKIRDMGLDMPCGAFFLSPWTDMLASGESYVKNYNNDVELGEKKAKLTEEKKGQLLKSDLYCFMPEDSDRYTPYISPIYGDFSDFPPIHINVGGDEMLLDDSLNLAKKIMNSKANVTVDCCENMFHTYTLYKNLMPESKKSYQSIIRFIETMLNKEKLT